MKKIFLVIAMLITSLFANPMNGDVDSTNENIIQNTLIEKQIINLENETQGEEIIEPIEEHEDLENDENEIQEDNNDKDCNIIINNNPIKNQSSNGSSNVQEQLKVETKTEPTPEHEPIPAEPVATQPAKAETEPKQEEKIYCVDGGSIHIYGDGANEHGYYKTWDEAFKAYEDYTKGWESTQFKVDQCACGLYYFWVTK